MPEKTALRERLVASNVCEAVSESILMLKCIISPDTLGRLVELISSSATKYIYAGDIASRVVTLEDTDAGTFLIVETPASNIYESASIKLLEQGKISSAECQYATNSVDQKPIIVAQLISVDIAALSRPL